MSVTAIDLLNLARELHQGASAEVAHRNVVGRAYYAAFHAATAFHEALPSAGAAPQVASGVHSDLFYRLEHPTVDATDELYRRSRLIGLKLRGFHTIRIKADYRLALEVGRDVAADALIKAAAIFALLT